jgi:hypothetical protein
MLGDSSGVGAIFKPFDRICAKAEGRKHCLESAFLLISIICLIGLRIFWRWNKLI